VGKRERLEKLEQATGAAGGRTFVLYQDFDGSDGWGFEPGNPVMTWQEFEERYRPTGADELVKVCYRADWDQYRGETGR